MRVIAMVLGLVPAIAGAEDVTLSDVLEEVRVGPTTIVEQPTGSPGIWGILAWGMVITPPPHRDARQFSEGGMVITPPDPEDAIELELGTNRQGSNRRGAPWFPRDLSLRFKRGADAFWGLVLPSL